MKGDAFFQLSALDVDKARPEKLKELVKHL